MAYSKYKRKDGKPPDPKKQKEGLSNKRRGAAFERRIASTYRKYGWYVQSNTKALYDLVCIPPNDCINCSAPEPYNDRVAHLLQPTLTKYPPKWKKDKLKKHNNEWDGRAYLVQRKPVTWELIFTPIESLK